MWIRACALRSHQVEFAPCAFIKTTGMPEVDSGMDKEQNKRQTGQQLNRERERVKGSQHTGYL